MVPSLSEFFKPTVVEDGNDQDHERREIKLPDQRDQHEPELHIYSHHQSLWFSQTNPTGEQSPYKKMVDKVNLPQYGLLSTLRKSDKRRKFQSKRNY